MSHIWGIPLACRLTVCLYLCRMSANTNAVPAQVATVEDKSVCYIFLMMTPHKESGDMACISTSFVSSSL